MKQHTIQSDYLGAVYEVSQYSKLVKKMTTALKNYKKKHPFDAIAFTGTSGAALAYPLSAALKIPLICVRKDRKCHYQHLVEGCITAERYVIIDDFISMGNTMKKITSEIKKKMPNAKPMAIFLYTTNGSKESWSSPLVAGPRDVPIHYPNKPKPIRILK